MEKLLSSLKHSWQELLIVLLFAVIFVLNLTPGAYLTGWDNLQTELNPTLGIKRAFFSVWQEFQSFGLTAGMGHAADLVRALVIYPLTLILPNWLVRYSFHMCMLLFAGLGALKLLQLSGLRQKNSLFALVGAVFYMLNFSTVQMMFLPFEAFSVFFASLPWLLWAYLRLFSKTKLSSLDFLLFILINILATPSFVAQQLFVVYGMLLTLLTGGIFIFQRNTRVVKLAILSALLVGIVNSFWLLPQVYFLQTNGSVVRESKINQIATEDVLYNNKDRGNLQDVFSFTGFFYDRLDQNDTLLFASWKTHRENPIIIGITILVFTVIFLGLLKRSPFRTPFILVYLLICVALLSNTEPITTLNEYLRSNAFINQIFRSPFTKFAIPHALVGAYFFAYGLLFLRDHAPKHIHEAVSYATSNHRFHIHKHISHAMGTHLLLGVALFLLLFQALPVFQGQYFSSRMKIEIPNEYHALMSYLDTVDENKRITMLPDYTFWGWFHTDWGYNGSGFLWYGIKQPFISRTFDVWSFESEGYFWEMKQAVEAENLKAFESILEKYDIDYILFDTSLLPIVADQKGLQYETLRTMLTQSKSISEEKTWKNLSLYKVSHDHETKQFVSVATGVPNIGPQIRMTNEDTAYQTYGTYQTTSQKPFDAYFPFLDLMTQTRNETAEWTIQERNASFVLARPLPFGSEEYEATSASRVTIDLYEDETAVKYVLPVEHTLERDSVSVSFPKLRIDSFSPQNAGIGSCLVKRGNLAYTTEGNQIRIRTSGGATGCIEYKDQTLDQRYGYVVSLTNTNSEGPRMYFYILDTTKEQAYVEDRLQKDTEYFILGPHFSKGLGYSFTFQNISYVNIPSTNTLESLSVSLMPYDQIRSYRLVRTDSRINAPTYLKGFSVKKTNIYTYEVSRPDSTDNNTVILSQAYQQGWKAYDISETGSALLPFLGREISDHVLINNWANGWNTNSHKLLIVYLPQYLQYAGFLLLIGVLLTLGVASILPKKPTGKLDKTGQKQ